MDVREQLLFEHSKDNADLIAGWIGSDAKRFAQLMDLFLNDEYRIVQRAAYSVSKVADNHPQLILPYLDAMVSSMMDKGLHIAVKRNVLRILQDTDIPEHLHGDIMNTCFNTLVNVSEPIAVRVFSMTVLDNLAKHYPEIRQELNIIIEEELERGASAGFRSRAKRILKHSRKANE